MHIGSMWVDNDTRLCLTEIFPYKSTEVTIRDLLLFYFGFSPCLVCFFNRMEVIGIICFWSYEDTIIGRAILFYRSVCFTNESLYSVPLNGISMLLRNYYGHPVIRMIAFLIYNGKTLATLPSSCSKQRCNFFSGPNSSFFCIFFQSLLIRDSKPFSPLGSSPL